MNAYLIRTAALIPACESTISRQKLYVTDSWAVRKSLLAARNNCLSFDELLSNQEVEEIDRTCEAIAGTWYLDGDTDVFRYRGISLGSIAQFHLTAFQLVDVIKSAALVLSILSRYDPQRLVYERSLLRLHDVIGLLTGNCSTEFMPVDGPPIPHGPVQAARSSTTRTLFKTALLHIGSLLRCAFPVIHSKILLITDNFLDELWHHRPAGQDFVTLFETLPHSRLQAIRMLLQGKIIRWAGTETEDYLSHANSPEAAINIHERWLQQKEVLIRSKCFCFRGLNLYPCIAPALEHVVSHNFEQWRSIVDGAFRLFETEKVRAVVVPADTPPIPRMCVEVANLLGIPTLVVQHGLKDYPADGGDMKTARYAAVWSEWVKEHRAKGRVKSDCVFVVGSPYFYKKTQSRAFTMAPYRRTPRRHTILVLPQSFYRLSAASDIAHDDKFLDVVLAALHQSMIRAKVIIKPHPSIRPGYYESLLAQYPTPVHIRVKYGSLRQFLYDATVVIGANSTGLIEAVGLKKEVICLNVTSREFAAPLDGRCGIPLAKDASELSSILDNILNSRPSREPYRMSEYAFGLMDGDHLKRLSAVICDLAGCVRIPAPDA